MGAVQVVENALEYLGAFEPAPFPVLSLYLNTQADEHGKTRFGPFVRKELPARAKRYDAGSLERESFDRDSERIERWLERDLKPSSKGAAIFACSAADLFRTVETEAPVDTDELHVGDRPHLYTLAKLNDQYRRYAALVADTHTARIFVFALRQVEREETVEKAGAPPSRANAGGWSQARYRRRVANQYMQHAKEIVEALDRIVAVEKTDYLILGGDEVILPVLREQMPQRLLEKVVEELHLDIRAPEHEVLEATLAAMRGRDARDDREKVTRLFDDWHAGGLAVIGGKDTLAAFRLGQVDELLIAAAPAELRGESTGMASEELSGRLTSEAGRTGAVITFIEDPALLRDAGGVGALLRFRV